MKNGMIKAGDTILVVATGVHYTFFYGDLLINDTAEISGEEAEQLWHKLCELVGEDNNNETK